MPTSGGASWAWQPTTTIGRSRLRGTTGKALQRWTSDSRERNAMRPPSRSEDSSSRSAHIGACTAAQKLISALCCADCRVFCAVRAGEWERWRQVSWR